MNSPHGAGGRRAPAPFGDWLPEAAPIMCSTSIKSSGLRIFPSIGHPHIIKATCKDIHLGALPPQPLEIVGLRPPCFIEMQR